MRSDRLREKNEPEIVYSHSIKAGRRIYYVDVKKDRNEDLFICITESKRMASTSESEEAPTFEKHKVFLYKEDFSHFMATLEDSIAFVKRQIGDIEERQTWSPDQNPDGAHLRMEEKIDEDPDEQPKHKGLFRYFK